MPEFQIKFKRKPERTVHKNIYSARKRAYRICRKGGWGTVCTVYRYLDYDTKYEIGKATAKGGDEVIWQFNGKDRYILNEDGTIKKV